MRQNKHNSKCFKIVVCCVAAVLALLQIHIPGAFAAESYFTADGGTLELDNTDPDHRTIWVKLKAAREMTIHYLEGYFTPVENDEELEYGFGDISAVFPGMGGNSCSLGDGWFYWNAEEYMDSSISSEGIHVQAGDAVFEVAYDVKDGVEVMKRNMPVTLELAVIDEGAETGKQIRDITMDAYVRAGHELSVYKYIMGNGDLDVPNIVIGGTDVEVGIVPEPGNELVYLELDGQDVTDQIQDNVFRITPGTESLTFYATFLRVYPVIEGDGGEHIVGSDEPLVFKLDDDDDVLMYLCDRGNLSIDGEYLDMRFNCVADPENQTIVLPADLLNTLELGEHSFEAYFSEPESGFARAKFEIVEEIDDDTKETDAGDDGDESVIDDDDGDILVPDTGVSAGEGDDAGVTAPDTGAFVRGGDGMGVVDDFAVAITLIGITAVVVVLIKKAMRV